jgi:hypothetical protein
MSDAVECRFASDPQCGRVWEGEQLMDRWEFVDPATGVDFALDEQEYEARKQEGSIRVLREVGTND